MQKALTLYQTSIGKKAVMAASGVVLFGFLVGHLAGNLNIFRGPEALNEYAVSLRRIPGLIWGTRIALLFAIGAHIVSALLLVQRNTLARSQGYKVQAELATNYAARTMKWGGIILLLYIVYHLAHLTLGQTFGMYEFDPHNVYNNVVLGFQQPIVAGIYIAGNLALGLHLYHGLWSAFQTMGASHPKYNGLRRSAATLVTVALIGGNLAIPFSVLSGIVQPTDESFYYPEMAPAEEALDAEDEFLD